MSFQSGWYLFLFLPAVFWVFRALRPNWRGPFLVLVSLVFYAQLGQKHLLVALALCTIWSYALGRGLASARTDGRKRALLWLAIVGHIVLLAGMKSARPLLALGAPWLTKMGLASWTSATEISTVGVSYFVLQGVSYVVDLYLGTIEVEKRILPFALYMVFFPRILQGPIERAGSFIPQLARGGEFRYEDVRAGVLLVAWGLFKKMLVADRLAPLVNAVYQDLPAQNSANCLLATYLYAVQIYCDFSGYTDMALGSARLFDIKLTQNFVNPYAASSIADFWRRWHISFSRWILDYIFRPLQMAWRGWGTVGSALALLVTFLISGLWHGATWPFVVWGALHGIYMAVGVLTKSTWKRIHKRLGTQNAWFMRVWRPVATFHLVCLAWIFFRAKSVDEGMLVARKVLHFSGRPDLAAFGQKAGKELIYCAVLGALVFLVEGLWRGRPRSERFFTWPVWCRWSLYYVLFFTLLLLSDAPGQASFIYFQF